MKAMKTSAKWSVSDFPPWSFRFSLIVAVTQWEVEIGKQYEPILTTRDGLWRYRLGDVLCIVGFHTNHNSPVFQYLGRRSSVYRHLYVLDMATEY